MANQKMKSAVTLKEGYQVEVKAREFKVVLDEPEQFGGTNAGMTPTELLLSALGSCLTITISMFSKSFHVDIKELKVDIEGELDPMGVMRSDENLRSGFSAIHVNVHIVSDAPQSRIERLVKTAEQKCPVSDTLRTGVPIHINCKHNNNEVIISPSVA